MSLITDKQAAGELGVSMRTLRRWEESGYFLPQRIDNSSIRVYHSWPVEYLKKILNLDRALKRHLGLLDGLRKELDKHIIEQDFIPGQPLKLMTEKDIEHFTKAHDVMEEWDKEFKKLLEDLAQYPNKLLQTTVEPYDEPQMI